VVKVVVPEAAARGGTAGVLQAAATKLPGPVQLWQLGPVAAAAAAAAATLAASRLPRVARWPAAQLAAPPPAAAMPAVQQAAARPAGRSAAVQPAGRPVALMIAKARQRSKLGAWYLARNGVCR
jgi:hypothetical protein